MLVYDTYYPQSSIFMTTEEFILKWRSPINHLGFPTVGIHVGWELIPLDSKVKTFLGKGAWEIVLKNTPPWFKKPQTFNELSKNQNSDYQQIVKEETENGKIEYYRTHGLKEPHFCSFANIDKTFMLLGDGNHRLLDCLHLINKESKKFDKEIAGATIDIIYLSNFTDVLRPDLIWKENWK